MRRTALLILFAAVADAAHFSGGRISAQQGSSTNEVQFLWSTGWVLGKGPCGVSCSSSSVGSLGTAISGDWKCQSSQCVGSILAPMSYTVTAINTVEAWEMGSDTFSYTIASPGTKYDVQFTGNAWRSLNFGTGGDWTLGLSFWAGTRSDTSLQNTTPQSANLPIYSVQQGCSASLATTITIPMIDADGDQVLCRWAQGLSECDTACNLLPNTTLNNFGGICVLTLDTSTTQYVSSGWYAVALTIEDLAPANMTVGGTSFAQGDVLSSVGVQFLVHTPAFAVPCSEVPEFNTPTPTANTYFSMQINIPFQLKIYAYTLNYPSSSIATITTSGPTGMSYSPSGSLAIDDLGRNDTKMITANWTPTSSDIGSHTLCFEATDSNSKNSEFRCLTLAVVLSTTSSTTTATTSTNLPTLPVGGVNPFAGGSAVTSAGLLSLLGLAALTNVLAL